MLSKRLSFEEDKTFQENPKNNRFGSKGIFKGKFSAKFLRKEICLSGNCGLGSKKIGTEKRYGIFSFGENRRTRRTRE